LTLSSTDSSEPVTVGWSEWRIWFFRRSRSFFELFKSTGHLLQAFLLRRRWLPWTWLLLPAEARREEASVHLVGFRPAEVALSVGARVQRVDDRDGQSALAQKVCLGVRAECGDTRRRKSCGSDGLE
jgi:hypothetical protein